MNDTIEELLADLVRIPSVSGDEARLAEFCCQWLEHAGLEVTLLERTVLARLKGSGGASLLLNTHLDTVPAGNGWHADPWQALWHNEALVGLGANDAKASVAAMMMAARRLAGGPGLAGDLILALNQEEETSGAGMSLVLEHLGPPDLAVTGEPTDLEVVRSQSGLAVFVATWKGRACHAAHITRVEHENALLAAARELAQFPDPLALEGEHPLLGPSTLAATVLTAGERHNQVPDEARATFDARIAAPHTVEECLDILGKWLPSAEIKVRSRRLGAVETSDDHPLVIKALVRAEKAAATGSNTLSDMALLAGVPAIKCGPGKTARSHTANEFITRTELARAARFYGDLARDCLQATGGLGATSQALADAAPSQAQN
ncbi:MAG: M20/M25/M40 family metallo-hydrolase [bacterium]|jgi:acetylornithine deacetylase|nr:M20/M25/M40 family metallo-hydrolase [Planctomycetota bacterium]HIL52509.1 M20/M25/M40 family metallo-hydrolase [Planctomycetota bacterium]